MFLPPIEKSSRNNQTISRWGLATSHCRMICSAPVDCRRARVSEFLGDFTPILQPSSVVNPGMRFDGSVIYRVNSVSNSR
jgi:hypothetical protein